MKNRHWFFIGLLILLGLVSFAFMKKETNAYSGKENALKTQDSLLRHIVLFKFKASTTEQQLQEIEKTFAALPSKIPAIVDFEWGTNNSPEQLDKGFTHSFFVSFKSEEGRSMYLPHPDHQAFVELAKPHIEDVLVFDYWAR